MRIGTLEVGGGNPCAFIAELSNNHNSDLGRAHRLIDAAKAAGASAAKLQCFTVDELIALRGDGAPPPPWDKMTMRELYSRAQTPHAWFPELVQHCKDIGLPWFSSVFGAESLALLESLDCPAYKIARLDNSYTDFLLAVWRSGKPMIVSEHKPDEARRAAWVAAGAPRGDGLESSPEFRGRLPRMLALYCPPEYPQVAPFDFRANLTDGLCSYHAYDCCGAPPKFDGFSYHGTSIAPPIVAATLGAQIIEAHLQLSDEPSELEANVSLTEHQFKAMIDSVRRVEEMLA